MSISLDQGNNTWSLFLRSIRWCGYRCRDKMDGEFRDDFERTVQTLTEAGVHVIIHGVSRRDGDGDGVPYFRSKQWKEAERQLLLHLEQKMEQEPGIDWAEYLQLRWPNLDKFRIIQWTVPTSGGRVIDQDIYFKNTIQFRAVIYQNFKHGSILAPGDIGLFVDRCLSIYHNAVSRGHPLEFLKGASLYGEGINMFSEDGTQQLRKFNSLELGTCFGNILMPGELIEPFFCFKSYNTINFGEQCSLAEFKYVVFPRTLEIADRHYWRWEGDYCPKHRYCTLPDAHDFVVPSPTDIMNHNVV